MQVADASLAPTDLMNYLNDPCCPLPTGKEPKNQVISKGPCQPKDHNFPADKRNRRFQVPWYEKFDWLEYSKSVDKVFCFYCRVFNAQVRNNSNFLDLKFAISE